MFARKLFPKLEPFVDDSRKAKVLKHSLCQKFMKLSFFSSLRGFYNYAIKRHHTHFHMFKVFCSQKVNLKISVPQRLRITLKKGALGTKKV